MWALPIVALPLLIAQPTSPVAPRQPKAAAASPYAPAGVKSVVVQMPALKYFCDGKQDALLRYFEASARWRVGLDTGPAGPTTVAYQRENRRTTLNGYVGSGSRQTRVGFLFEAETDAPPFMATCVTRAAPDAGPVGVTLCTYSMIPQQRHVTLYVGKPGLWLSIILVDEEGKLAGLAEMLAAVETELKAVQRAVEGGDPLGALDSSSVQRGEPSLKVDDSLISDLQIEAWVNPGAPGITEVRVKRVTDDQALTVSHSHLYARERVGYAPDAGRLFYANSLIRVKECGAGFDTKHDLIFQYWFIPDTGGPERLLVEHRKTVKGYEN